VVNRQYDLHTIVYSYDGLSRLIDADYCPGGNINGTPFRAYDYAYDPAGNRTQKIATLDGSPTTTNYTYNALNQLTSDGTHSYTYDDNGNLTSDGVNTYTWDRANRLLGMGGHSYAYNGLGQRLSQTVDSVATQYLLDVQPELWTVLAATTSGQTERYLHGPLGIHAQEDEAGEWRWMVPDALGSVRGEFDADLDMQAMRDYAPYGDPFGEQGAFASPFGFTGEPYDENGVLHLRARYYDPRMARFLNMDPSRQEENPYAYVAGNPVMNMDPGGLILESDAPEVYRRVRLLEIMYGVHIKIDFGISRILDNGLVVAQFVPYAPGMVSSSCNPWIEGKWDKDWFDTFYSVVTLVVREMGGSLKFSNAMSPVPVSLIDIPGIRSNAIIPGTVVLDVNDFHISYDRVEYVITHELGHRWDWKEFGSLSQGMREAVGTTVVCTNTPHSSVCSRTPSTPTPGSADATWQDYHSVVTEDWANSFAAYILRNQSNAYFTISSSRPTIIALDTIREQFIVDALSNL
jgi:RHS repeat-associated protein